MEQNSDLVAEGKLIGETSYLERSDKYTEVEIDGVKIDFYDARNQVVHEVKKSDKIEQAHIAQVKYYLYKLWLRGAKEAKGVIEYPVLKRKHLIVLDESDFQKIKHWEEEINILGASDICPPLLNKSICKKCSYNDFCYSGEE